MAPAAGAGRDRRVGRGVVVVETRRDDPCPCGDAGRHGRSARRPRAPRRRSGSRSSTPGKGESSAHSTQPGSVHWFEAAELYAKISGYLKEQSVDIGDRVKQGQLLAVIDNPEVIEDADRAAAALVQAKAAVTQAEARVRTTEADLKTALAMVKKAEADIARYTSTRRFREKELARYQGLLAQKAFRNSSSMRMEEHYESAIAAERSAEAEVFAVQGQGHLGRGDGRTGQGRPRRGQGERRGRRVEPVQGQGLRRVHQDRLPLYRQSSPSAASTGATSSARPKRGARSRS